MKSTIPLFITAATGFVIIAAYFIPSTQAWQQEVGVWFEILAAVAFVLGGANLCAHHLRKISDRKAGWGFSAVTMLAFVVTLVAGLFKLGVPPEDNFPGYAWSGAYLSEGSVIAWIFEFLINPLTATMFSLLAFFVASAAFRGFRAKNVEATLLLGTAFIILLGQTYTGTWLTEWMPDELSGLTIPGLKITIMSVFNTAGQRAIMIGIALGVVATSLKVLLGVDRSYLEAMENRALLEILTNLDRRWVFLAMLLAVAIPILAQKSFPEKPTKLVQDVFDKIESLPQGSRILFSFDYDPNTVGELAPMATALIRHCCLRRDKMYFMTLIPTGLPLLEQNIQEVIETEFKDEHLKYGEDYVNLGYKPGQEVVIKVIGTDLRQLYLTDNRGISLNDIPMTKNIKSIQDMDLILELSAGAPGTKEWVQYAATPLRIPLAAGVTGVQAPQMYPYIPDQLLGLLPAIKGAAEYEAALGKKYPRFADPALNEGIRRMAPQLWAHLLMVSLIVLGNVIYFAGRWRGQPHEP